MSATSHLPEPPEEVAAAIAIAFALRTAQLQHQTRAHAGEQVSAWQRSTRLRPAWTSRYPDAWTAQVRADRSAYPE